MGSLDAVGGAVDDFSAFEILARLGADVDIVDLDVVGFKGFVDEVAPVEAVEGLMTRFLIGMVVPLPSARMLRKDIRVVCRDGCVESWLLLGCSVRPQVESIRFCRRLWVALYEEERRVNCGRVTIEGHSLGSST